MYWQRPEHFFTSDPHFGDARMLDISGRPFHSAEEADEAYVERWNNVVGQRDVVWVLGDVTTDTGPSPHISRLNGVKYLVAGNHDTCSQLMTPDDKARTIVTRTWLEAGFRAVVDGAGIARSGLPVRIPLRGGPVVALSHYPYDLASWERSYGGEDPFAPWRPKRPKKGPEPWLLHGHVHQDWSVNGRQINVGVDIWDHEPVSAEVIAGLIESD